MTTNQNKKFCCEVIGCNLLSEWFVPVGPNVRRACEDHKDKTQLMFEIDESWPTRKSTKPPSRS